MIGIAVAGCGYWGPNLIRNFSALEDCELRAICDPDPARLAPLRRRYPAVRTVSDFDELLAARDVDGIAIATPVHTHFPLASQALRAGKHVLVEKPLAQSVEAAEALVALAARERRVLQVDHTFVYSGAVQRLKRLIDAGDLGELLYVDSVRINLGLIQHDVNVLWDLATHDVSILTYLVDRRPEWVSAIGCVHLGRIESQAYVAILFEGGLLAHLHVNWLAPVKLRSTVIGGSKRMVVYDDLQPSEKLRVYDKGAAVSADPDSRTQALVDYRLGDMFVPHIEKAEPLERVCAAFVEAIATGQPPLTDGRAGLEVVRILETAEQSMRRGGERLALGRRR